MKNWKAQDIKSLRLMLGWTCSDLARRLGCEAECIRKLEAGESQANSDISKQLDYLLFVKEESRKNLTDTAVADAVLKENNLDQIDSGLVDKIKSD